jgi:hypothetical protein
MGVKHGRHQRAARPLQPGAGAPRDGAAGAQEHHRGLAAGKGDGQDVACVAWVGGWV